MRHYAFVSPATEEEMQKYKEEKIKLHAESFNDKEKQNKKSPLAVGTLGKITFGLCPTCNHCVTKQDHYCDECYQMLDWN